MPTVKTYHVPSQTQLLRSLMKPTFRLIFHILGGVQITGKENVPYGLPYVAAMNHVSIFDPPFILSFWPEILEAIGAVDLWSRKGQSTIVKMYGVIPVHRGEYDRHLMDTIQSILTSRPLLIAPEGGRSHAPGMRRAMPGIGFILERAQVPVLPVGLVGTTDDYWQRAKRGERPQLEMHIGKPFNIPVQAARGAERHAARQQTADLVMEHIAQLLPPEYRGVYSGQLAA